MSIRMLSRAVLLFLLVALTAPTANVAARNGRRASAQESAQAERKHEGARKGTTYDEAGRAVKTTVPTSESERVTVSLKYDERNRVQSVLLDDGTQVGLVYDASGLWQGFSFADGGKMLFQRDASGKIVGVTRVAKSTRQRVSGINRVEVRRVGFVALTDGCATATASMVAAAAVAVANCLEGPSVQCATAVAAAAVAAARAYEACKDSGATEESAA